METELKRVHFEYLVIWQLAQQLNARVPSTHGQEVLRVARKKKLYLLEGDKIQLELQAKKNEVDLRHWKVHYVTEFK